MNDCKVIDFEEGWYFIQIGIQKMEKILDGHPESQFTAADLIILYTTIFNMCMQNEPHDCSQQLYDRYGEVFKTYITSRVLPSLREKCDEFMLMELVQRWSNHKIMVFWLSRFFSYLDRFFTSRKSLPSLTEVGHATFNDLVFKEVNFTDAALSLIAREREDEQIDQALLRSVLDIFVEINHGQMEYYQSHFEEDMIRATEMYYSQKASNWIEEDSFPCFLQKAEGWLKSERRRACSYLHVTTEPKLVKAVEKVLLSHLVKKVQPGCDRLIKDLKVDDLSRLCRLFSLTPQGRDWASTIIKQHFTAGIMELVEQEEDSTSNLKVYVEKLIELNVVCLEHVKVCFNNDFFPQEVLHQAMSMFDKGVTGHSTAELLAAYFDNILKVGGSENLSDEITNNTLEKAVKLINYTDKELFGENYRRNLSGRLLSHNHTNVERERSILRDLRGHIFSDIALKMEVMVDDIALSAEEQSHFENYLNNNPTVSSGIDLSVTVLRSNCWPRYKYSDLNLPAEMGKCVNVFEEYYKENKKNRKLAWSYSLGNCSIIGYFPRKAIKLVVKPYQASTLLLFNSSDRFSYEEIQKKLNLSDTEILRILYSLSCGKYKLLRKEPDTKTITSTDKFEFNLHFTDKRTKIKIPFPPLDKEITENMSLKGRPYVINACMIRIMKRRKELKFQELMKQCAEDLGKRMFNPDVKDLKRSIEHLIVLEFLERDKDHPDFLRLFAVVDDIFCLVQGHVENVAPLKQQYGLGKTANEVINVIEAYRTEG